MKIKPIKNNENYFYKTTTPLNARGCSYASLAKNIFSCFLVYVYTN